ncbi:MAG: rubredoxin [Burkholderiales bacterium]|nr:rubredoxin [Burkholderiales bacterium]MBP9768573.1 rubredoxin [Burkholderiales bacterium]
MIILKQYMCEKCGFVYSENEGYVKDGILPGTIWENVPQSWFCPECGVQKEEFFLIEF